MSKRIIISTPEPSSGAARYVSELVKALVRNQVPVRLLCPSNFAHTTELIQCGVQISPSAQRGTEAGGLLHRITRNLRFLLAHFQRQFTLSRRGDIVHIQFPQYFPFGLLSFLLAKMHGCRIVFTAHDPIPHKWLLPSRLRVLERSSLKLAYMLSDRIIVHNQDDKDLLTRDFGQSETKIAIIPHGPFCLNTQAKPLQPHPRLKLLMFGSIREDKGLHLGIEAVQQINREQVRVELTIAGAVANTREQAYWAKCQQLIQSAPAGIAVEERYITDSELSGLVANCHAMLLPYTGANSESGVAAVALANGRPILARNAGGLATLLRAADLGMAIDSPTLASVRAAIEQALQAGIERLAAMGANGAEFLRSNRSWENIAEKTSALYARV